MMSDDGPFFANGRTSTDEGGSDGRERRMEITELTE